MSDRSDTTGATEVFVDPLWRVEVRLTALERGLLRRWEVRRLGFLAHAGAASITSTQSYSRLEHTLGLLALVVHFDPEDHLARVAALLHDVGHLPFSHTFEGVAGLNHHRLGAERVRDLAPLLADHGMAADDVLAAIEGTRRSTLRGSTAGLRLDHLESFVRSGRAHGRTSEPPPFTLARLRLVDGVVHTDEATGAYLRGLIVAEARAQCSSVNVAATGVLRNLVTRLLAGAGPAGVAEVARSTDAELWVRLLRDPQTASQADLLRRDPARWTAVPVATSDGEAPGARPGEADELEFELTRLYLDLPVVDGRPPRGGPILDADLPRPPLRYRIKEGEPGREGRQ